MKKIVTSLLVGLLCFALTSTAQVRPVSGIIKDDQGNPIPFATVKIKGSKTAVAADAKGTYRIEAKNGDVLVVSSVGFLTRQSTVSTSSLDFSLSIENNNLSEVIVTTALNIKRKADNLSYASQGVKGDKLTTTRNTDVNSSLAGKIAGIQVRSESGAKLGATATVRLRGAGSLGDVNPLYVIDGTPVANGNDINTDDVEDIQVLKGPAATALYGQRAEGGVIMITTKKGNRRQGIGVEVASTVVIDKIGLIPRYQNEYSGGAWLGAGTAGTEFRRFTYDASMPTDWKALDGKYYHLYNDDASWGPRMVGQEYIPWYAWYPGTQYSYKTAKLTPQPNNIRDFWNKNGAAQFINSASLAKAGDGYNFRLSYTNINQTGLLPSSGRLKNYITTNLTYDINKHFTAGVNFNYTNESLSGEFDDTYGNNSSGGFNQWFHRDLDMNILREFRTYRTPDGVLPSWNLSDGNGINGRASTDPAAFLRPNYWFDEFSYFDNINNKVNRNRLLGDINLTYKINSHIKLAGFIRRNTLTTDQEVKVGSVLEQSNDASSVFSRSATNAARPIRGTYMTQYTYAGEDNYEFLGSYDQKFGKFAVDFNLGANDRVNETRNVINSTKGGLTIPNLFTLSNSIAPIFFDNQRTKKEVRSFYGRGSVNWNDIAVLDFSLRNDNSSALAPGNNSYTYPSIGASLILTKFVQSSLPFVSFAKVRGSYAQIGSDIDAYRTNTVYTLNAALWGTNALTTTPDVIVDPNVKPALSSSYEAGIDLRFLKNRISVSATYYNQKNKNQIVQAPITGSSGFAAKLINAGEVDRNGIELSIDAIPVISKSFRWDISVNAAHNNSRIVSLAPGVHQLYSGGGNYTSTTGNPAYAPGAWQFDGTVGGYGSQWGQLIGIGIQKYNGTPVLDATGQYVPTTGNVSFGSVLPDFTGGMVNSFTYENFNLSFAIDFCKGGKYYSLSDFWGKVSGLYDVTAGLNDKGIPIRNNVSDGGGVHVVGVDNSSSHTTVDRYVDAGTYYHQFYNHYINENSIYDLTYIKVREISFGYKLPLKKLGKFGASFQNINVSAVCRNPFLIYTANKNIDPSELVGNYGEAGQFPPTRSIGLTVKLGF